MPDIGTAKRLLDMQRSIQELRQSKHQLQGKVQGAKEELGKLVGTDVTSKKKIEQQIATLEAEATKDVGAMIKILGGR